MRKVVLLLTGILWSSCAVVGQLTDAQQTAVNNITRAMAIADAAWSSSMKGTEDNMYMADTYNTQTGSASGPSDVWPYTAAIEAHNSILEALNELKEIDPILYDDYFDKYKEQLIRLIDNLEYYRGTYRLSSYATSNKEWSVYAVPRASVRGTANVTGILNVYDDQMWLARELIRAYRLTDNEDYLELASYLTDYVLEGWDCWRDENGEEYGGITWGPGYNSKHACSNSPIIQPLVWLSDIYSDRDDTVQYCYRQAETNNVVKETLPRTDYYLDFAKRIYHWQKDKLQHSSGVFWDMMGAPGEIIVSRGFRQHVDCGGPTGNFYSYNTGTMIAGAAELFRVTDDEDYRDDLSTISKASLNKFAKYVRKQNAYEFNTDATATSGFNTWFNDVLMRSYVDAYPYTTNTSANTGLTSFQTTLDYAFENHNRNNLLPIRLLDGWGNDVVTKAFHQFAFASEYALLAKWLLSKDQMNAVEDIIMRNVDDEEEVYSLTGRHIGTLKNVRDSLPKDVYIVGHSKVVLGK
ncbi:MAG: hypothetical protein J1F20_01150 [Muribaculaceae bacterium]|nr:hypothetical protein [Muribaculaceae bacterium]